MEDYQKRVIEEHQELNSKIVKLTSFLFENLLKIKKNERELLQKQLYLMLEYSNVLTDRIDTFK